MHLKEMMGTSLHSLLPLFLPDGGNVGTTAGAPATILDHEVIMRVETLCRRETKQRSPIICQPSAS